MGDLESSSSTSRTFPCKDSTLPFWRTELHELDSHRSTEELPKTCDILIIGGGYAGISAAYHLLCGDDSSTSPKPSVVLAEAREACSGATARNGGHLRPSVYSRLSRYIKQFGVDAAVEVADFELDHVQAIAALVEKENIACDFTLTRSFDIYTDEIEAEAAKKSYEEFKSTGIAKSTIDDLIWIDAEHAEEVSGVKDCVGCFSFTAAHLWPYKLFTHLLADAVSCGLNLQTHTPILEDLRGHINASKVIFAMNGYTAGLLPEYTKKIVPSKGICCRIVASPTPTHTKLTNTYALHLPNGGFDYLIPRNDGSIIVGGARSTFFKDHENWYNTTDDSTLIRPAEKYFDDYMQRNFLGWEESEAYVDRIWTGIMGYTSDLLPSVGEVPGREGCFIAAGFVGHGMPVIWLTMKGVAEMVRGGKTFEDVRIPRIYKTTKERLESDLDLLGPVTKG
ncbi:FAD dependent oxidoreductase [Stipitochalara longipes BDJ]|nr:FAD dependent oxidoreductase [Stipitochalara longipes BDJ]